VNGPAFVLLLEFTFLFRCFLSLSFFLLSDTGVKHVGSLGELKRLCGSEDVLILFYTVWCGACEEILPRVEAKAKQLGTTVLAVNTDIVGPSATPDPIFGSLKVEWIPALAKYDGVMRKVRQRKPYKDILPTIAKF
jgi:thiol-disulfide isomerase/thioredoxin